METNKPATEQIREASLFLQEMQNNYPYLISRMQVVPEGLCITIKDRAVNQASVSQYVLWEAVNTGHTNYIKKAISHAYTHIGAIRTGRQTQDGNI